MRKLIILKVVSLFIITGITCHLPAVERKGREITDYSDRIVNPGFEEDFNGWSVQNGVFADGTTLVPEIVTGRAYDGEKSVYIDLGYGEPFTTECRVYQIVRGLPAGEYILSAQKFYGRWEEANGIFVNSGAGDIKSVDNTNPAAAYKELTITFNVTEGADVTLGIFAASRRGGADRNDYFWMDHFRLTKVEPVYRQAEYLNRGVVGVKTNEGIYLSWRLLGTDDARTTFNIYRDGTLLNATPLTTSTNYVDTGGSLTSKYVIKALLDGKEIETSEAITPWEEQYKVIQLNRPEGGVTPDGVAYTYTPNDCSAGDLDGDGEYEIIVKWDPSNSKDNSQAGYTGNVYLDAYKIDGTFLWRIDLGVNIRAGAHYTQFMVYDLDGDGIAEIACKTAPGTIDGKGNYVLLAGDDPTADYRNASGYILEGPEYLTVFSGRDGSALATVPYNPPRGDVSSWGDNYGNRVDRFLATVAYLDGQRPSLVMCRGYYTRVTLAAYDFRDGSLMERWFYDSGTTDGIGGYGQGNHNLSVADVDGDGKDEIIYGACAIDDDGTLMYSTGLGHGDAIHVSDLMPDRPGLEVFCVHEEDHALYGTEIHDAATGEILWGIFAGDDVGRGIAADVDADHRGYEMWSSQSNVVYNVNGNGISLNRPSYNFRIYWDGDLQDELLDGTKLDKWNGNGTDRLFTFYLHNNAKEINGSKANPCLSADLLGDWREEVIYYNSEDPSQLMIFTTVIPADHRL